MLLFPQKKRKRSREGSQEKDELTAQAKLDPNSKKKEKRLPRTTDKNANTKAKKKASEREDTDEIEENSDRGSEIEDVVPMVDGVDGDGDASDENETQVVKRIAMANANEDALSFEELGVCQWLVESCAAMGIKRPTPVQRYCIPEALKGKDVMGLAETGSGKTAAFAIPILQHLSADPYGVFALVLTPTRELAIQISEQFEAIGAPMNIRVNTVIGGLNMTTQSLEVSKRPHVIVATPGRLIDHLEGPQPPFLKKLSYLVLDEADRILAKGFESELNRILAVLPPRQTLLFSATMSDSIQRLRRMATKSEAVLFELIKDQAIPQSLVMEYLFMPAKVKLCYLVEAIRVLVTVQSFEETEEIKAKRKKKRERVKKLFGKKKVDLNVLKDSDDEQEDSSDRARSAIIFTGSCQRCQEVTQVLMELGVDCVCLHSLMNQRRRLAALGKFKSQLCRLLIATDVASRGLDIPDVDLVINYDMPRAPTDFVHRCGRTARAGRRGRALSLVTQHDIDLVHAAEQHTGTTLNKCDAVTEKSVLPLLNPVSKALRVARQKLTEVGFDEKVEKLKERSKKRREKLADEASEEAQDK